MDAEPKRRWQEHLPAILILGSPVAAAGMMLSVALTDIFLLPESDLMTVGVTLIVPINALLGAVGAAAGALRVGGTVPTRIAVLLASVVFAAAVYLGAIELAAEFIPGFANGFERYGP